jgi:ssDNA-binding Zn-finger/Zn-ribbon topoisomerase 1
MDDNFVWQWPPRVGQCPACGGVTLYAGESFGRRFYYCDDSDCKYSAAPKNVVDVLTYARFPWMWAHFKHDIEANRAFNNDILERVLFMVGENMDTVPVFVQCNCCGKAVAGLWSLQATAGFQRLDGEIVCDTCSTFPISRSKIRMYTIGYGYRQGGLPERLEYIKKMKAEHDAGIAK